MRINSPQDSHRKKVNAEIAKALLAAGLIGCNFVIWRFVLRGKAKYTKQWFSRDHACEANLKTPF